MVWMEDWRSPTTGSELDWGAAHPFQEDIRVDCTPYSYTVSEYPDSKTTNAQLIG